MVSALGGLGVEAMLVLLYREWVGGVADAEMDRVDDEDGVTLPDTVEALPYGVIRPVETADGIWPDDEAVIRPPWIEATEEGRDPVVRITTVGGDNLVVATKTPHFGAQSK